MKKIITISTILLLMLETTGCNTKTDVSTKYKDASIITLNSDEATINGKQINEYNYTWHVDLTSVHQDTKDAPAEYYTGEKPNEEEKIYIDHELYYYPLLETSKFKLVNYDGEIEYAYYYEDGENNEYIFSTLPYFRSGDFSLESMMFSEEEASKNKVLHINESGTYVLEGNWNGQIKVDLGEDSYNDENAKVTIILNGVNISCSVAPAVLFENAYECDNTWNEKENNKSEIDTTNAGVTVVIADDSINNVSGKNIYRMLKTKYKNEESADLVKVQKKQRKYDAPFYSCVSMNINGEEKDNGVLNITSSFEGLDSELHLTINGGNININSMDDGINVNEDDVSVVTFNGGTITINAAQGPEGDGVDSNGYVVIDGANLYINNIRTPDNAIDSQDGITYKSGNIYIDNKQEELNVGNYREIGGGFNNRDFNHGFEKNNFDMKTFKEEVAKLDDNAGIEEVYGLLGMNNQTAFIKEDPRNMDRNFNERRDIGDMQNDFNRPIPPQFEEVSDIR